MMVSALKLPHLKMHVFQRGFNFAALLKTLLLSLSVCMIDISVFELQHHIGSLNQCVSLLVFI